MALSDMKVFNEYIMPATKEALAQMVEKFNAASAGAIRLSTTGFDGDFYSQSFFSSLHSAQRRVDRYASLSTASPTPLAEAKLSAVKVAGGFGPISFEPAQLTWLQRPTAQGVEAASTFFADALLKDMLNTSILALVAAIENQSEAKNDVSDESPVDEVTYAAINSAHAKFGDHSTSLIAHVMTGSMFHKLIGQNLANEARLFSSNSVNVVDILGKAVIVTDAPALFEDATEDLDKVLSLVEGAAELHQRIMRLFAAGAAGARRPPERSRPE